MLKWVAEFIGLFKMTADSEWPEICSSVSLIIFYIMVYFSLNSSGCDHTYSSSDLVDIYLHYLVCWLILIVLIKQSRE